MLSGCCDAVARLLLPGAVARMLLPGCCHKGAVGMGAKTRELSGCFYLGAVGMLLQGYCYQDLPGCYEGSYWKRGERAEC